MSAGVELSACQYSAGGGGCLPLLRHYLDGGFVDFFPERGQHNGWRDTGKQSLLLDIRSLKTGGGSIDRWHAFRSELCDLAGCCLQVGEKSSFNSTGDTYYANDSPLGTSGRKRLTRGGTCRDTMGVFHMQNRQDVSHPFMTRLQAVQSRCASARPSAGGTRLRPTRSPTST